MDCNDLINGFEINEWFIMKRIKDYSSDRYKVGYPTEQNKSVMSVSNSGSNLIHNKWIYKDYKGLIYGFWIGELSCLSQQEGSV